MKHEIIICFESRGIGSVTLRENIRTCIETALRVQGVNRDGMPRHDNAKIPLVPLAHPKILLFTNLRHLKMNHFLRNTKKRSRYGAHQRRTYRR